MLLKLYVLHPTYEISNKKESRKVKGNAAKRRPSSGLQPQGHHRASQVMSVPATRKKIQMELLYRVMQHTMRYP
jgi:hypothetical protein